MTVEIKYKINGEVVDMNEVYGGTAVLVNGNNIMEFIDESAFSDSAYDWAPEYAGSWLHHDFIDLITSARELARGQSDIYEDVGFKFNSFTQKLILEPVSADYLRIAYRVVQPKHGGTVPPRVVPESARGYLVDRCAYCHAVSDAAHEYVADLESMPIEWGLDLLDDFKELLVELDEALDTCAETPPE